MRTTGGGAPRTAGKYGDHTDFRPDDWVRTPFGTDAVFVCADGATATIRLNADRSTATLPLSDLRHHPDDVQYWRRASVHR